MPSTQRQPVETRRYTPAELYELRREIIKHARSIPPGPDRNEHRQIASSVRSLLKDTATIHADSNRKAGERVARDGETGTIVEVAREIKVKWDNGRTSYFRNLPANVHLN